MTSPRRFESDLPAILGDLYLAGTPDYRDDLVRQTARVRQRPAWTFPERWLPMAVVTRRPFFAPNVPWRALSAVTLLALLLAAALVAYIGSQTRLPSPFGLADNGLVAYAQDGDIYTADPVTGQASAVVTGPETDLRPIWSLDGTRFVFERKVNRDVGAGLLYIAKANGAGLTRVTPEPLPVINGYAFSPDGMEIMISEGREGFTAILIASTDGTDIRTLPLGTMIASEPAYRPPTGAEIVFVGKDPSGAASGLFVVKPDGTGLRPIVQASNLIMVDPKWSPDGSRIAYSAYAADYQQGGSLLRAYVVSADGQSNRLMRDAPPNDLNVAGGWSNDGTRLFISGCHYEPDSSTCVDTSVVVNVDGNGPAVAIDAIGRSPGADGVKPLWAPNDQSIVTIPTDTLGHPIQGSLLWDPLTGQSRPAPWTGNGDVSWQRTAH